LFGHNWRSRRALKWPRGWNAALWGLDRARRSDLLRLEFRIFGVLFLLLSCAFLSGLLEFAFSAT